MLGPDGLKQIIYPLLALVLLAVISYVVYYNLKMKARDKELGLPGGAANDTPSKILAEKHAAERAKGKQG